MAVKARTLVGPRSRSGSKPSVKAVAKRSAVNKRKSRVLKQAVQRTVGASSLKGPHRITLPRGPRGEVIRLAIEGVIGRVAAVPEREVTRILAAAEQAAAPEARILEWLRVEDRDRTEPVLEAAFQRGDERKAALLREPTMLTGEAAAARLGVSRETINKRAQQGKLLALEFAKRGKRYPDWQFEDRLVGPPVERVLAALMYLPPWERYRFFTQRLPGTAGRTPIEALRLGEVEAVRRAAETWAEGEQGGG